MPEFPEVETLRIQLAQLLPGLRIKEIQILILAGIHPKTPSYKLSKGQITRLFDKLLKVLREGIEWRGASRNNFRDAYGSMVEKQEHFYVYERFGKMCINRCGGVINRIALGGRGTFYCSKCQVI